MNVPPQEDASDLPGEPTRVIPSPSAGMPEHVDVDVSGSAMAQTLPPSSDTAEMTSGVLAGFEILAELGRGAQGGVYLARQTTLAGRPIVLKTTPHAGESLSLARLQHTHIVPLYWVQDRPGGKGRILCMPYFGNLTVAGLLQEIRKREGGKLNGQTILDLIDAQRAQSPVELPVRGPARPMLARSSYSQAICWMGACLAEALQYAHERGLVHLDLKPANILLTGDGQPMLLDFHLARPPYKPGDPPPRGLGATLSYASPEQSAALEALACGQSPTRPLDQRSDIYSLGLVLYQALGGVLPLFKPTPRLETINAEVSTGLADMVHKCLEDDAARRYGEAGALAADLRAHLNHQPLRGVRNRSWKERFQKWRKRRPFALPLLILLFGLMTALVVVGGLAFRQFQQNRQRAEESLFKGRTQIQQRQFAQARETLAQGLELAQGYGGDAELARALAEQLRLATRASQAEQLHQLAETLRFQLLFPTNDQRSLLVLDVTCRQVWDERAVLLETRPPLLEPALEQRLRRDLVDLAIGWADVRQRLASPGSLVQRQQQALSLLREAEGWGHVVPAEEWQRAGIKSIDPKTKPAPATAWQHFTQGRSLLRAGNLDAAFQELEQSVHLEPSEFDTNFCLGVCAARLGKHVQATAAFSVCIGQAPVRTEPFLHRGRSHAALGEWKEAAGDFNRALALRPHVPEVLLERGTAFFHLNRHDEARKDLEQVIQLEPSNPRALELLNKLQGGSKKQPPGEDS